MDQIRHQQVRNASARLLVGQALLLETKTDTCKGCDSYKVQIDAEGDLVRINLKPLYDGPRPINLKKLNDLKALLQFVPPVHHPYLGLVNDHCMESGNEASGDESS